MSITKQTLAYIALASGVLGGAIGSLATAATSSSASPAAVAAAVQRVKDSAADADLAAIRAELEAIKSELRVTGLGERSAAELLTLICKNTAQGLGPTLGCSG